jgi:type IV secretory pathway protease TraF
MTPTKRRIRGVIALVAAAGIALLIHYSIAMPYPNLKAAYLISVGVALWGVIDLFRSLAEA